MATVQGYLSDALLHGFGYDWHRLSVPAEVTEALLAACHDSFSEAGRRDEQPSSSADEGSVFVNVEMELKRRGVGLSALRERLPDWGTYGHIRLGLAHISRTQQQRVRRLLASSSSVPPSGSSGTYKHPMGSVRGDLCTGDLKAAEAELSKGGRPCEESWL